MRDFVTECGVGQAAFRWELQGSFVLLAELRLRLRADLARHAVPADAAADIVLAVQEASKNALRVSGGQTVSIAVWVSGEVICVSVKDQGRGFVDDASPSCPSVWRTRGRGLYLMRALMDSVEIDCSAGTSVSMQKRLARSQSA
jgi:anti-sigma regulatory factor (Ser/Thr protein kinase)